MRFLIVLFALVHATGATAQVLEPGAIVRLAGTSQTNPMRTGRVDSVSIDSALVRFDALRNPDLDSFSAAVPLARLEKYVGERTLQKEWAIIGALFGGVVGYVAGTRAGEVCDSQGCIPETAVQISFARAGLILGASVGAVAGARQKVQRWVPVITP